MARKGSTGTSTQIESRHNQPPAIQTKLTGKQARKISKQQSQNALPAALDNPAAQKRFIRQWLRRHNLADPDQQRRH